MTEIYIRSSCNKSGSGGYGIVMINNGVTIEYSHGFLHTTCNRMDIMAMIRALKETKGPVKIFTDNTYVKRIAEGEGRKIKANYDLWRVYWEISHGRNISLEFIEGCSDNKNNVRSKELSTMAVSSEEMLEDEGHLHPVEAPKIKRMKKNDKNKKQKIKSEKKQKIRPKKKQKNTKDNKNIDEIITKRKSLSINLKNTSIEEYAQIYDVKPECAEKIIAFYKNEIYIEEIRTHGSDIYSSLSKESLKKIAGKNAENKINKAFTEEKDIENALRWNCRGLKINDAIQKVVADKEQYRED